MLDWDARMCQIARFRMPDWMSRLGFQMPDLIRLPELAELGDPDARLDVRNVSEMCQKCVRNVSNFDAIWMPVWMPEMCQKCKIFKKNAKKMKKNEKNVISGNFQT